MNKEPVKIPTPKLSFLQSTGFVLVELVQLIAIVFAGIFMIIERMFEPRCERPKAAHDRAIWGARYFFSGLAGTVGFPFARLVELCDGWMSRIYDAVGDVDDDEWNS